MKQYLFVGSTNPVKINAVRDAVAQHWPEAHIAGHSVESGVSEQPRGDDETALGAQNRARAALEAGVEAREHKMAVEDTVLGIGLEGGVVDIDGEMFSTVWVAVQDRDGNQFVANGARFPIHPLIAEPIRRGEEMGPLVAQLVGEKDVRSKQGMIGIITDNFVTRTEEYTGITKMAIGQWYGRGWHETLE